MRGRPGDEPGLRGAPVTSSPSMLPVSGEQHEKAREAAMHAAARVGWGASTTDATLAAYFASLAAQGVRLVDVREVADWLRSRLTGNGVCVVTRDPFLAEFLARFGGGDGA